MLKTPAYANHPAPELESALARFDTINDLIAHWAEVQPEKIAFSGPGDQNGWRRLTWASLREEARGIALGLVGVGVKPGDHIGILADGESYVDCLVAYLSILHAGAVMVPLNPRNADHELKHAIEFSDCAYLVIQPKLLGRARPLLSALPKLRRVLCLSGSAEGDCPSLQTLRQHAPAGQALPSPKRDDLANIIFTSGTTARPKAVMHTHGTALATGAIFSAALGLRNDDVFHHAIPFFTSSGTQFALMPPIWVGATLMVEPGFDAAIMLDRMEAERSTAMIGVPSHYLFLLDELTKHPRPLPSMRLFDYGGASMPGSAIQELARRYPDMEQRQQYGLTETGPSGTLLTPDQILQRIESAGRPMPLCEIKIVNAEGQMATGQETGEIAVRSPACMSGYYKDPAATAATLVDGWVHTGDIGHLDPEGFLYYSDRKKDIVNRGGLKLSSVEVEEVLYKHPDVLEAAVVAAPHDKLGEDILAFIVLRTGTVEDAESLRAFCRERLADYKSPRQFRFLPEFPKNPMGKIQKNVLRDMARRAPGNESGFM